MIAELDDLTNELKVQWMPLVGAPGTTRLVRSVDYLIHALDELILKAGQFAAAGVEKKATVMRCIGELYDIIVPPLLPFWLRPFSSKIRSLVLDVVVSLAIDYCVWRFRQLKPEAV